MKAFQLREKKTFIKILKEPPVQKKKVNWSRRLYLAIFLVLITLVGNRVYLGNMYIHADGQIELPKQLVTFPDDIQVMNVYIKEGNQVCKGDTLFRYLLSNDQLESASLTLSMGHSSEWIDREVLSGQKKISFLEATMTSRETMITYLTERIEKKESLLLSGVNGVYNEYEELSDRKTKLLHQYEVVKEEKKTLQAHIYKLERMRKKHAVLEENKMDHYQQEYFYISPSDGVISDIFYKENEICYKKAEMMTIHEMENVTIETFFDPIEIAHLEVGDEVVIQLPDGSDWAGLISRFYVSTYALPSEFQKKYEPTERNIVAEVIPMDKASEDRWKLFYKMDVKVKKSRYQLF